MNSTTKYSAASQKIARAYDVSDVSVSGQKDGTTQNAPAKQQILTGKAAGSCANATNYTEKRQN